MLLADWSLVTIRVEALTRKNPPGAQRHPGFIESRLRVDSSNHAQSSGLGQRIRVRVRVRVRFRVRVRVRVKVRVRIRARFRVRVRVRFRVRGDG